MDDIKILVAVVSGLFALLGGFIGAWLARRTEYEKWIRQERSNAFSEFLRQMHEVREKAINIIYDSSLPDPQKAVTITELFTGLNPQENIVRLYLKQCDREKFSKLTHELWILHSLDIQQSTRLTKIEPLLSEIQSIFEKTIHG